MQILQVFPWKGRVDNRYDGNFFAPKDSMGKYTFGMCFDQEIIRDLPDII